MIDIKKHRANNIMKYFNIDLSEEEQPKSFIKYIDEYENESGKVRLYDLLRIIHKLENENLLLSLGKNEYFTSKFNEQLAEYGSYVFISEGFKFIHAYFSNAIRPIFVKTKEDSYDIGTGFYFANNNYIVTAKHVVDNMKNIMIYENNRLLKCFGIYLHKHLDLAILKMENSDVRYLCCPQEQAEILDTVITIGYPPIAKFEAIEITEKIEICSHLTMKTSQGTIVGIDRTYDNQEYDYLVLNARVKGGNSGGPVINNMGCVVGVITEMPRSMKGTGYDELGYGLAIPHGYLTDLWNKQQELSDYFECANTNDGFYIIKN